MATVLILGATSEMAMAIAREFASRQFNIQLAARNTDQLIPLKSDLEIRFNINCSLHTFDALNFSSHAGFFERLNPKPDVTVCVFGYLGNAARSVSRWEESETIIHTNFTGAVSILNIIANYYEAKGQGAIAGISSVAGERGRQSNYMYGSAKAGFTTYLSGLRNRLFNKNVHVATILPGFVYTKMTEGMKLPKILTAHPAEVGEAVFQAVHKKKNVIYVRWFWRWIMLIIKLIPEPIFKKLKL
jgi:short-subunit dehydrogenase